MLWLVVVEGNTASYFITPTLVNAPKHIDDHAFVSMANAGPVPINIPASTAVGVVHTAEEPRSLDAVIDSIRQHHKSKHGSSETHTPLPFKEAMEKLRRQKNLSDHYPGLCFCDSNTPTVP